MKYKIKTSKYFEKDFEKLESSIQTKVLAYLESMTIDPFIDIKKLKNVEIGIFRKRIGNYRIRFDIIKDSIYLYRIRHRKDIYKDC